MNRQLNRLLVSVLGIALPVAPLVFWCYFAPASGWLIVLAYIGLFTLFGNLRPAELRSLASVVVTVVASYIAYVDWNVDANAGWVSILAVLSGLIAFRSTAYSLSNL
jgi:hypothetical protein